MPYKTKAAQTAYLERTKEHRKRVQIKWRAANRGRLVRGRKSYRLMKEYGLSFETYEIKMREQNGLCWICKRPGDNHGRLSVDHNHSTGKVRGLLCVSCNHGIGNFRDNALLLQRAINYLENYDTSTSHAIKEQGLISFSGR